ncbi:MAG: hypothetical protein NT038_10530, partial [Euryarchaeota archaeon]|nr:hypothetical protein [Euryarchaeota archaeon]
SLVYHKMMEADADGMVWEISGASMYSYTHTNSKGAGIYSVTAYGDVSPAYTTAKYIYGKGESGGYLNNLIYGYNSTFGNTAFWLRFLPSGTSTVILDWGGNRVDTSDWTSTTYRYSTCGPFDPPEYWSGYENFTVEAGVPTVEINNGSSIFWNSTGDVNTGDNDINLSIYDYDDNDLTVFTTNVSVMLYNKENNPKNDDSVPIAINEYSVRISGNYIMIAPFSGNKWGYNVTSQMGWANDTGKLYVVLKKNTTGNASEEWNGTTTVQLTSAQVAFKWIDDDDDLSSDNKDGVIPKIPPKDQVPITISFQITDDEYKYWGDLESGDAESITQAAENITISGNSLFTGSLDTFPGFTEAVYFPAPYTTWYVPIIPTMSQNGGEITISVDAYNTTLTETLSIGGGLFYQNGSVVTVTPNDFQIWTSDQTLSITVKDANGNNNPYATAYLYYIDEAGDPIEAHNVRSKRADSSGAYTLVFNQTQQTENQTDGALFAEIKAPRNLTVYIEDANAGYGYALVSMKPRNNIELELSQSTVLAGYEYEDFYLNCTLIGNSTVTPKDADADKTAYHIKVINEDDEDVTDTLLNGGDYDSSDLTGDYTLDLSNVYITEPGTYTFYAYNNTCDTRDHNATLVVDQVLVACDKSPLIWSYDENISATFTITYQGSPITGNLIIDNMTAASDYNKTYANTSFDGTNDLGGNSSIEISEDDIVAGVITVHDITANYLDDDEAEQYITFWFQPTQPTEGVWARAKGTLPVSVPMVTPDKTHVALGKTSTVNVDVTGRGIKLSDVYVRLHGSSIDTNGTSDTTGRVSFSILPAATGNISIDVGEEGRTTETVIIVTGWVLAVTIDPVVVNEGQTFTVTALRDGTTTAVNDAQITFNGVTKTTDATGKQTFEAPSVTGDRTYTVTVAADGYASDPDTLSITVVNVPTLYLSIEGGKNTIATGQSFTLVVGGDDGNSAGIAVTFNSETKITAGDGKATFAAPTVDADTPYTVTATKDGYNAATPLAITVTKAGVPGFELLTLVAALGVAFILLRRRQK